jgi:hypothetical protein
MLLRAKPIGLPQKTKKDVPSCRVAVITLNDEAFVRKIQMTDANSRLAQTGTFGDFSPAEARERGKGVGSHLGTFHRDPGIATRTNGKRAVERIVESFRHRREVSVNVGRIRLPRMAKSESPCIASRLAVILP